MLVKENIGLGKVQMPGDESRIRGAAEKSLASELIRKFKHGYQQMLGRRFEGGVDLSAGQWQKIALARAYMRDAQAEYEVFPRFADLTKDKMAVLISHRFSTVRMADRILVLDSGHIIEQGSHDDLRRHGGRYAELFELQAADYR